MQKRFVFFGVGCLSLAIAAAATMRMQEKAPPASPPAKASCDLGAGQTITVDYSRPRPKGRKIFGGLVPYGQVWRAGANEAPTFVTTSDDNVGGTKGPAGRYTHF